MCIRDSNRPLHAYDADKIDKEIVVRNSKSGETFTALDGKNYKLGNNMCVISDRSGPLGLGGIIGGSRSGTEFDTKNILLESAYFVPSSIRKTSKLLGLETDAKYRFERGIDPNSMIDGLKIATDLVLKICGGEASKFEITGKNSHKSKIILRMFIAIVALMAGLIFCKAGIDATVLYYNLGQKIELEIDVPIWWMYLAFPTGFLILILFSTQMFLEEILNLKNLKSKAD